jgi:hypothetical protein
MAVTLNASTSSGLVQTADTSGTVEIQSNGTTRLTVASGGVTATNLTASGTFGGGVITSGTAVTLTNQTSVDFTSIPSWVKRVTIMLNGVSLNGSANFLIQLGDSGGVETTGYNSSCIYGGTAAGTGASTSGFLSINGLNTNAMSGALTFSNLTGNVWVMTSTNAADGGTVIVFATGSKTLSATLDRVRITTTNGTDQFDAGTINILYEG